MTRHRRLILVSAICFSCSCGKKETPAPERHPTPPATQSGSYIPTGFDEWPAEKKAAFLKAQALAPLRKAQDEKDRRELVRPAPPDFKPANAARKIKLILIPQKTALRKGESLWYRLELQNIGQESIIITDKFFKDGLLTSALHVKIHLTRPDGTQVRLSNFFTMDEVLQTHLHFPALMSEKEKRAAADRMIEQATLETDVSVELQPGEILATRPWRHVEFEEIKRRWARGENPQPHMPGEFRELFSNDPPAFDKPGRYRLKAVYDDPPPSPPGEEEIKEMRDKYGETRERQIEFYERLAQKALGRIESDRVTIEISP